MAKKKEKPLTKKGLLKLIKEHGGPEELDLSGKKFEEEIDLSGLDLHGIIIRAHLFRAIFNGCNLDNANFCHSNLMLAKFNPHNSEPANLQLTDLRGAHLEYAEFKDANLSCAKFGLPEEPSHMKAHLDETDFKGANLFLTDFTGCFLYGTKLQGALIRGAELIGKANIAEADWGNHIVGEEQKGDFKDAERQYRYLKQWYIQEGIQDVAGKFHFREMEVKRKALQWRMKPHLELWYWTLRLLCGYGEKPLRVVISAVTVVLGMAIGIWAASALTFLDSLYYSAVSFTALGYGLWVSAPEGWVKALGATEAFIGVFMIALFLITFVRKMTR